MTDLTFIDLGHKEFCQRLSQELSDQTTADQILKNFFVSKESWQLRHAGYNVLRARYQPLTIKLDTLGNPASIDQIIPVTGRLLLNMSRCIRGPWYINPMTLYIWDPIAHFELTMTDGNLDQYFNFKLEKIR